MAPKVTSDLFACMAHSYVHVCVIMYLAYMIFLCSYPLLIKYLDDHPHLFTVDPLLLQFLVHASPLELYDELVTKVPLFMLLAALSRKLSRNEKEKV